jgi:hypothetical protein
MEKYYSQGAAPLKRWAEGAQNHYPLPMSAQVREVFENGTVNDILALAQKYPDMQGQIYWQAMAKAESSGDIATARQIASDSPNEEQRRYMLAQIDRDQAWRSMNADQMAAIQQRLSNLRNNDERIQFLLYVASRVGGNDRKAALGLANQAGQIIDSTTPGKSQLEGQIALAMLYCSLKSDRGFAIMESLIPKLNELVAGAATLDGFENHYLRDGEWNMTGEGVVGGLLTALAQNAGYFADLDFDRSVTLARQFDRAELRLMAELKIAQSVLGNQRKQVLTFNVH